MFLILIFIAVSIFYLCKNKFYFFYFFYLKFSNYLIQRRKKSEMTRKIIFYTDDSGILKFNLDGREVLSNLKRTCFGDGLKIGDYYYNFFDTKTPVIEEHFNETF